MSEPDINALLEEQRRAEESYKRLEYESFLYREAYAKGGKLGPPELYEAMGKAIATRLDLAEKVKRARQKEEAGLVEIERAERVTQAECTSKRIAKRAINVRVNRR